MNQHREQVAYLSKFIPEIVDMPIEKQDTIIGSWILKGKADFIGNVDGVRAKRNNLGSKDRAERLIFKVVNER